MIVIAQIMNRFWPNLMGSNKNLYFDYMVRFTHMDLFAIQEIICPTWLNLTTLFTSIGLFCLSLIFIATLKYERKVQQLPFKELFHYTNPNWLISVNVVQRAVQLMKDFKFKRHQIVYMEFVILALIASTGIHSSFNIFNRRISSARCRPIFFNLLVFRSHYWYYRKPESPFQSFIIYHYSNNLSTSC